MWVHTEAGRTSGLISQIFVRFNSSRSEERGAVEQVHDSSLHAIITEQIRDGNDTDRLQRVWDIIRQEQLHVKYKKSVFPIISGNLSLSRTSIARAQLYFETITKAFRHWNFEFSFMRDVLAGGGANTSCHISIWRSDVDNYTIVGV